VTIDVAPREPVEFALRLRIPSWTGARPIPSQLYRFADAAATGVASSVNGEPTEWTSEEGYALIRRQWQSGDRVELMFQLPVRRVLAREEVQANRGRFAVQRGPLVYCAEELDNAAPVRKAILSGGLTFQLDRRPDLLGGITAIRVTGPELTQPMVLIPYHAWANRQASPMRVWFPTAEEAN
jgi:DUF1680 family protein